MVNVGGGIHARIATSGKTTGTGTVTPRTALPFRARLFTTAAMSGIRLRVDATRPTLSPPTRTTVRSRGQGEVIETEVVRGRAGDVCARVRHVLNISERHAEGEPGNAFTGHGNATLVGRSGGEGAKRDEHLRPGASHADFDRRFATTRIARSTGVGVLSIRRGRSFHGHSERNRARGDRALHPQ